jgi:ABC-type dipeptide/oligopeptide/nickel transport system permease subunit
MLKPPIPDHHSHSILWVDNFGRRLFHVPIAHRRGPWKLLEVEMFHICFKKWYVVMRTVRGATSELRIYIFTNTISTNKCSNLKMMITGLCPQVR